MGDDLNPAANDDEDGVVIPPLVVGQTNYVSFEVSLPSTSATNQAYVDGWIDFDGNKQWDSGEQFVSGWYGAGVHTVAVTPPATSTGTAASTFARVRINSPGPLGPKGVGGWRSRRSRSAAGTLAGEHQVGPAAGSDAQRDRHSGRRSANRGRRLPLHRDQSVDRRSPVGFLEGRPDRARSRTST